MLNLQLSTKSTYFFRLAFYSINSKFIYIAELLLLLLNN